LDEFQVLIGMNSRVDDFAESSDFGPLDSIPGEKVVRVWLNLI
jgi:hypothetical protein